MKSRLGCDLAYQIIEGRVSEPTVTIGMPKIPKSRAFASSFS